MCALFKFLAFYLKRHDITCRLHDTESASGTKRTTALKSSLGGVRKWSHIIGKEFREPEVLGKITYGIVSMQQEDAPL